MHLTLTSGKPLSNPKLISDLVDGNGYFLTRKELEEKPSTASEQINREFAAQYRLASESGLQINHIDSHHFAAVYPALKHGFINFSIKIRLPVGRADAVCEGQQDLKVLYPDALDISFYDSGASLEWLKNRLLAYKANSANSQVSWA